MATIKKIQANLWFATEAEEAVNFYTSIFKNSSVGRSMRYAKAGHEIHMMPVGSVMTIEFEIDGQPFVALNAGPLFKFNEAISFIINCKDQEEIDYYWAKLTEGGDPKSQQCGWLKDKFGLSWQVVPERLAEMGTGADEGQMERVMSVVMATKKFNIAALEKAFAGK